MRRPSADRNGDSVEDVVVAEATIVCNIKRSLMHDVLLAPFICRRGAWRRLGVLAVLSGEHEVVCATSNMSATHAMCIKSIKTTARTNARANAGARTQPSQMLKSNQAEGRRSKREAKVNPSTQEVGATAKGRS